MPLVVVRVGGKQATALVDSGCSTTVVTNRLVSGLELLDADEKVKMMDGSIVKVQQKSQVKIQCGEESAEVRALVVPQLVGFDIDVLLDMDVIKQLGGAWVPGGVGRPIPWQNCSFPTD